MSYPLHCVTVKFNVQIIYLSIYYIDFINLFIVLMYTLCIVNLIYLFVIFIVLTYYFSTQSRYNCRRVKHHFLAVNSWSLEVILLTVIILQLLLWLQYLRTDELGGATKKDWCLVGAHCISLNGSGSGVCWTLGRERTPASDDCLHSLGSLGCWDYHETLNRLPTG